MRQCHNHNCHRDGETGDLWCPVFGGWQVGGCPMRREDSDKGGNDNERNDKEGVLGYKKELDV